jgi:hypothetical protein
MEPDDEKDDCVYEYRACLPGHVIAGMAACVLGVLIVEHAARMPNGDWDPVATLILRCAFHSCVALWLSLNAFRVLRGNAWGCRLSRNAFEWHWPHWFRQEERRVETRAIRNFQVITDCEIAGDGVALSDYCAIQTDSAVHLIPAPCVADDVGVLAALLSMNPAIEVKLIQHGVRLWPPHRKRIEKLCQDRGVKLTLE